MSQKTLFTKSALAVAVTLISTQAWSVGFQLNGLSSSGLGRAYPGEGVVADNVGNISRNPALTTMLDRLTFSVGAVYIDPDADITGHSDLTGQSVNIKNIVPTVQVPSLHFIAPVDDQFGWGASITPNYGLATEFTNNYTVSIYGGKTDLQTINLNPSGVYRLSNSWGFGLGFDAVHVKAKAECCAGSLGPLLSQQLIVRGVPASSTNGTNTPDSQIAHLRGDEWGFGWNVGTFYELDKDDRWGLTYRSEVKIDFDGDYKSFINPNLNSISGNMGLPYGTMGATQNGSLTLNLPEMWEISGYNRAAPQWVIHCSMVYTSWSQLQESKAKGDSGQTLFYKDEEFRDAYRIALGTTHYYDKDWAFHTGIAYDDSPVPADKRSISISDQDRLWLSAGLIYASNEDVPIDVGVSYMHGQKMKFTEGEGAAAYFFESEGKVWLFGTNFNYAF